MFESLRKLPAIEGIVQQPNDNAFSLRTEFSSEGLIVADNW